METAKTTRHPRIGEVYNVYFEGTGNEQAGWRPGVVFQNNVGNACSPNVIILPMTSSVKKLGMPTHVLIKAEGTELRKDSVVICENPSCISKSKLGKYITTLPNDSMREIAIASIIATSAISFLDLKSLVGVWEKTVKLNRSAA